jgi:hypothetical protein
MHLSLVEFGVAPPTLFIWRRLGTDAGSGSMLGLSSRMTLSSPSRLIGSQAVEPVSRGFRHIFFVLGLDPRIPSYRKCVRPLVERVPIQHQVLVRNWSGERNL